MSATVAKVVRQPKSLLDMCAKRTIDCLNEEDVFDNLHCLPISVLNIVHKRVMSDGVNNIYTDSVFKQLFEMHRTNTRSRLERTQWGAFMDSITRHPEMAGVGIFAILPGKHAQVWAQVGMEMDEESVANIHLSLSSFSESHIITLQDRKFLKVNHVRDQFVYAQALAQGTDRFKGFVCHQVVGAPTPVILIAVVDSTALSGGYFNCRQALVDVSMALQSARDYLASYLESSNFLKGTAK